MAKKVRRGQKQCSQCGKWVKGTRTKTCPHCDYQFNGQSKSKAVSEPVKAETTKPAKNGDGITIHQIRAAASMVAAVGGFERCYQLLDVIRDIGGVRRMTDLLAAISTAQGNHSQN